MKRHRSIGRSPALAVVLGLSGSLVAVPAAADGPRASQVRWGACPEDVVAEAAPTELRCATVPVPVDYADPGGARIDLMISRLASTNPEERRGTLMLNPGGPGGAGLAQAALLVARGLPADVLDSYDLIGMDTRGIGHSAPVTCGFTPDGPYTSNIPPYAADDTAVTEQAKTAEKVAEQCARQDRDGRLRHLTTANTARDLDRIRAELGEEKTSYLGYSYGTALGAAYASMFPERSDRIVLDSNIGDTHLDRDGLRRYALGMEQTFPDFAKWAAARHDSYGLGRTPAQVRATYLTLAERLDKAPVAGFDGSLLRQYTFGLLFKKLQYPKLAQQWQALADGDDTAARRMPSQSATAGEATSSIDNPLAVFAAVTCNDIKWPANVDTYRNGVAEDRTRYPLFGAATANITPCAFWPHTPAEPPVAVNDDGPRNVLLVQNLRDPATPHLGGRMLRQKFADRSRLLSVDDSGHGAYVLGDNPCALNTTTRYLVEGAMPGKDTLCRAG
ncbi:MULTISPECIES: alpha/beta hydrolase [Streptomyces]|uniref:Alpha/beta hydrolase n=1 Tax=Streptomyces koelreuteriae TaxID=2838015 RepID=A0ABX8FN97_9ACTN|nr:MULTISPECIES: alpha/beta hydrolase [Streptomyces]QWB22582.1 alpha/beta hydrolase [Streptomyces koelreuteriae]UUA05531.1 alpha/beta hydrolase [Streptomyces koelreuteriae]UUA13158.1 alpha/beta hydrolase [Streptomyces sp. CRCS-T-1]